MASIILVPLTFVPWLSCLKRLGSGPPSNPQNPQKKKLSLFFLYVKWFGFGEGKGDKGDEGKGDKGEALLTTGSMI